VWRKVGKCRCQRRGAVFVMCAIKKYVAIISAPKRVWNQLHAAWPSRRCKAGTHFLVTYRGNARFAQRI
jgi:hypothetical protein